MYSLIGLLRKARKLYTEKSTNLRKARSFMNLTRRVYCFFLSVVFLRRTFCPSSLSNADVRNFVQLRARFSLVTHFCLPAIVAMPLNSSNQSLDASPMLTKWPTIDAIDLYVTPAWYVHDGCRTFKLRLATVSREFYKHWLAILKVSSKYCAT